MRPRLGCQLLLGGAKSGVEATGGFPTESITEELLTTVSMLNKGYKTRCSLGRASDRRFLPPLVPRLADRNRCSADA